MSFCVAVWRGVVLAAQVQEKYGWSSATIDLLAAWGPIVYIPVSLFTAGIVGACACAGTDTCVCPPLADLLPGIAERIGLRATITLGARYVCVVDDNGAHAGHMHWAFFGFRACARMRSLFQFESGGYSDPCADHASSLRCRSRTRRPNPECWCV